MVQYESRPSTSSYLQMDRLFALFWHMSSLLHVVTAVAVTGFLIGFFVMSFFLIGFFVPGLAASTTATNTTNVTRRIAKNFIVGLDSVLMTESEIMVSVGLT